MELEYPAGWSRHEGGSIKRPKLTVLKNQVQLDFEVSQGSDERTYKVKFHASEDFVSLVKAMVDANRDEAIKAFDEALGTR